MSNSRLPKECSEKKKLVLVVAVLPLFLPFHTLLGFPCGRGMLGLVRDNVVHDAYPTDATLCEHTCSGAPHMEAVRLEPLNARSDLSCLSIVLAK